MSTIIYAPVIIRDYIPLDEVHVAPYLLLQSSVDTGQFCIYWRWNILGMRSIHFGRIQPLNAFKAKHVIALNPDIAYIMGADCDGDCVTIYTIPTLSTDEENLYLQMQRQRPIGKPTSHQSNDPEEILEQYQVPQVRQNFDTISLYALGRYYTSEFWNLYEKQIIRSKDPAVDIERREYHMSLIPLGKKDPGSSVRECEEILERLKDQ